MNGSLPPQTISAHSFFFQSASLLDKAAARLRAEVVAMQVSDLHDHVTVCQNMQTGVFCYSYIYMHNVMKVVFCC